MRRRAISRVFLFILTLVLLAFFPWTSRATSLIPREDYTKASPDNAYLLVMLVPTHIPKDGDKIKQDLRAKYKVSGLYKNDGSNDPLWTLTWWYNSDTMYVSSDGKHLVHINFGPSNSHLDELNDDAVYFYENGNVLKSYPFSELITDSANLPKPQFNGPWGYSWLKSYNFDDSRNAFTIATLFGEEYRFDVTTGKIDTTYYLIDKVPWPAIIVGMMLLIGLAGFVIDLTGVFRKDKPS